MSHRGIECGTGIAVSKVRARTRWRRSREPALSRRRDVEGRCWCSGWVCRYARWDCRSGRKMVVALGVCGPQRMGTLLGGRCVLIQLERPVYTFSIHLLTDPNWPVVRAYLLPFLPIRSRSLDAIPRLDHIRLQAYRSRSTV